MKRIMGWIPILALLAGSAPAFAQHDDHHGKKEKEPESRAEIRVYIADKDKQTVNPKDLSVSVVIEPKGMAKKMLATELVAPHGDKKTAIGHGGDVVEADGFHVELVVHKIHSEEGHGDHKDEDAAPYFKAPVQLTGYGCGMEGHPILDKPGACPKCPMAMKPVAIEFAAVVIFKVKGQTKNAKGFQYPPAVPATYGDAVAKIETHLKEIDELIEHGDLDKVHAVAERISHISEKLPGMAHSEARGEVEKLSKEIVALFKEIDHAADAGKKDETVAAVKKYRAAVEALKKHAH